MPPPDFADTEPLPPPAGRDELTGQDVARQVEHYSNAIVAFSVVQALTFSYLFGTNALFSCLVRSELYLGAALLLMFITVLVLITAALQFLGRLMASVAGRFREPMRHIYRAKLIAVVVFTLLPMTLTLVYGVVRRDSAQECRRGVPVAVPVPATAAPSVLPGVTRP